MSEPILRDRKNKFSQPHLRERRKSGSRSPRSLKLTAFEPEAPPLRVEAIDRLALYLEMNGGIESSGIFRLAGDSNRSQSLYEKLCLPMKDIDLSMYKLNDVAEAFKMYIRLQHESVFPTDIYLHFNSVLKLVTGFGGSDDESNNDEIEILIQLCQKMPTKFKDILRRILRLLWDIHQNADVNKMTADNLSTIFGPCLVKLGSTQDIAAIVKKSQEGVEMCKLLILHCTRLMHVLPHPRRNYVILGSANPLPGYAKELLAMTGNITCFKKNSLIYPLRSSEQKLYLITSGTVRLAGGNSFCMASDIIGEVVLFASTVSILKTVCITDVTAVEIDYNLFCCLCEENPDMKFNFYWEQARQYANFIRRMKIKATKTISSVPNEFILEKDTQVNVILEGVTTPGVIHLSQQDKISDLLFHCAELFEFQNTSEISLEDLDGNQLDGERHIQTLLENDSKVREVTVNLKKIVLHQQKKLKARSVTPRRRIRSKSADVNLRPSDPDSYNQYSSKSSKPKVQLEIYPRSAVYRINPNTIKDKKHSLKYSNLKIELDTSQPLTVLFTTQKRKKLPFTFESSEEMKEALLLMKSLIHSVNITNKQNDGVPDWLLNDLSTPIIGRAIIQADYLDPSRVICSKNDIVLVSEKQNNDLYIDYCGLTDNLSSFSHSDIKETEQNLSIINQKLFTNRALNHLPTPEEWKAILDTGKIHHFEAEQTIIQQGDRLQRLCFVTKGTCTVVMNKSDARKKADVLLEIRELEQGDCFGAEQILLGGESRQSLIAFTPCDICIIEANDLKQLIMENILIGSSLMKYLATYLYSTIGCLTKSPTSQLSGSFVSPGQVSMHASNVLQWRRKKKDQYLAKTAEVFFEEYYTKNPLNKDGMTEEEWKQRQTRREQAKSRRK